MKTAEGKTKLFLSQMLTEIKNIKLISRYIRLNTLFRGFIMTSMN